MPGPAREPRAGDWIVVSDLRTYEGPDGWLYIPVDSVHETKEEAERAARVDLNDAFAAAPGEVRIVDLSGYSGAPVGPLTAEDVSRLRVFGGRTFTRTNHRAEKWPSVNDAPPPDL